MNDIPYGYCHCGCGQKTRIAPRSSREFGHVKGEPVFYLAGHGNRRFGVTARYVEEDRGHDTPCWTWKLALARSGYGWMNPDGISVYAHRWYYEQKNGPIGRGQSLHHLCHNRDCVNPDHLEPLSKALHAILHRSPLSEDIVREIRQRVANGESQKSVGFTYGVRQSCVSNIVNRKTWKHVA